MNKTMSAARIEHVDEIRRQRSHLCGHFGQAVGRGETNNNTVEMLFLTATQVVPLRTRQRSGSELHTGISTAFLASGGSTVATATASSATATAAAAAAAAAAALQPPLPRLGIAWRGGGGGGGG